MWPTKPASNLRKKKKLSNTTSDMINRGEHKNICISVKDTNTKTNNKDTTIQN